MPRFSFPRILRTLAAILPFSAPANAQNNSLQGQQIALNQVGQALGGVVRKARTVNLKLGYGFNEGGCVFGARLRPGSGVRQTFSLGAGQSFVFIGGGDASARNLDLVLRDAGGRIVSQDIEADAAPFLLFRPKISGRYTLSMTLKTGWNGSAFCALTVLRKGGAPLPLERIFEAAIRLDTAAFDAFRAARGGRLSQTPGGWALFGAVTRPGGVLSTSPQKFGGSHCSFLAVGDSRVHDLDLALLDDQGKRLASDTKHGIAPRLTGQTEPGVYALRVTNRSSTGPAMVMAILLDLPARTLGAPSSSATPNATPTATPNLPATPQVSPFEGQWKGDFAGATGRVGNLKIEVKANGDFTGRFAVPTLEMAAKLKGAVFPDGAYAWQYTQKKQDGIAEGNWKWSDETHRKIEGRATFSSRGAELGSADFTLEKQG